MKKNPNLSSLKLAVDWPAVICYQGDDELTYVADEMAWLAYCEEGSYIIEGQDKLIDSRGQLFHLMPWHGRLSLVIISRQYLLADLLLLVQKNACLVQQVCSAKIGALTHKQAIEMIDYMNT